MFHVHAWGFPYAATLLGIKQIYPGRYVPANLLRLINDEGATFTHCVPTILQMLLAAPEADKADLSRLKMVIGGSALPKGLAAAAMDRGVDIYAGYGLSETCPVLTFAHLDPGDPDDREEWRPRRFPAGHLEPQADAGGVAHQAAHRQGCGEKVGLNGPDTAKSPPFGGLFSW